VKSALELAMERTASMQESGPLTDEQRSKISELEKEYQAKIAEMEIMVEARINAMASQEVGAAFSEQVGLLREEMGKEKALFEKEKAAKIQAVRDESS
jgi:hypothetical protein